MTLGYGVKARDNTLRTVRGQLSQQKLLENNLNDQRKHDRNLKLQGTSLKEYTRD